MAERDETIRTLIERLKTLTMSCEDKHLDLKTLQFDSEEGEMRLYNQFHSYYFKSDPKNPKDIKITHAVQQFCKIQGVPYSFFAKNPEHMKKSLTSCWLPSLKPEKSSVLAKLRKTKDSNDYIIRALLPVEYTNISNIDVLEALSSAIGDTYKMEFAIGDDRDDLILHARFLSKEEFEVCGEKCCVGFSVICSDLGASPLMVETFLHRIPSKASFLVTYSTEAFFSFDYEKIQKTDLQNMFPPLVQHLQESLLEIKNKIQSAKEIVEKKDDIYDLLRSLRLNKSLNEKFHTLMFQELESDSNVKTRWDFVNKMSILAKDFPVDRRLKIERAAGNLLDLTFNKV
jgi:hypothetical protein